MPFAVAACGKDGTPEGNVDLYVRDSSGDTGEHASPQVHWHSPDIWVRSAPLARPHRSQRPQLWREPRRRPPAAHQQRAQLPLCPGAGIAARRRRRPTPFRSRPSIAIPAPACCGPTILQSMGTVPITPALLAGGSVRVGPFVWTPQIQDHECLLAIVHGASDPAIAGAVIGPVDHWKLVRFDNNVGQRNVSPQSSVPGGKTKTSLLVRGTTHPSTNSLTIDASALPADTEIKVRVARSMTDEATSLEGLTLSGQNSRWSTLDVTGGTVGVLTWLSARHLR